ncbi:ParB N-terminal domain-containing protein [Ligilactobacillus murinus]|uniref:ParB N-terminal domain-containing protein n=1 Tax=Ligilactobacillus murinus TaxID=1622 RepID=UPI001C8CBAAC|nr:ParB N-terminal domain-containing protein [Ligilactobacillus murinus]MBX9011700.1 ParB N-terminal domain-containing protein [Ligilactobacillus murinus]
MKVIEVPIDQVKPYENNPRINDDAVQETANSIKEFGWQQPIVVDKNNVVIVGHTRLKAAKKLKLKKVPVVIADTLSEQQVKAYRLADNKTGELADWDVELLDIELDDIVDLDMSDFGFDDIEEDTNKDLEDLSDKDLTVYQLILDFENEEELQSAYGALAEEGYQCKISTF